MSAYLFHPSVCRAELTCGPREEVPSQCPPAAPTPAQEAHYDPVADPVVAPITWFKTLTAFAAIDALVAEATLRRRVGDATRYSCLPLSAVHHPHQPGANSAGWHPRVEWRVSHPTLSAPRCRE